jgi:hypothetical protein
MTKSGLGWTNSGRGWTERHTWPSQIARSNAVVSHQRRIWFPSGPNGVAALVPAPMFVQYSTTAQLHSNSFRGPRVSLGLLLSYQNNLGRSSQQKQLHITSLQFNPPSLRNSAVCPVIPPQLIVSMLFLKNSSFFASNSVTSQFAFT